VAGGAVDLSVDVVIVVCGLPTVTEHAGDEQILDA